ncbi:Uncharacterised protein [uncultured Prevotella sp.]|nr:Uncharacterised protein [uncultured Prevotella sp.]
MYYQLSEFYKRDIYLQYAEENSIKYNAFEKRTFKYKIKRNKKKITIFATVHISTKR